MAAKPEPLSDPGDQPVFHFSRQAEYFEASELATMTGQPIHRFPDVLLKELLDNGADAAEAIRQTAPRLDILIRRTKRSMLLVVRDNGPGIEPETVRQICDFNTRTSSKAGWLAPTRGLQGYAVKTVLGIPFALGSRWPVVIRAQGVRHTISVSKDLSGNVRVVPQEADIPHRPGTVVVARLPLSSVPATFEPRRWARGFALFNPHAAVRIREFSATGEHAQSDWPVKRNSYLPTVSFSGGWRKFLPTDLTSPWWYDAQSLRRLIGLFATTAEGAGLSLRMFIRKFRGLSGTAKSGKVARRFPEILSLSDFERNPERVVHLLGAMRAETKAPSPDVLGLIGKDHFQRLFCRWHGCREDRFWYAKERGTMSGPPFIVEAALGVIEKGKGHVYHGINFSPSFGDPMQGILLSNPEFGAYGLEGILQDGHAHPRCREPCDTVAAFHVVAPGLQYLDKGKSRLQAQVELVQAASDTSWSVAKTLYREGESRRRDAARQGRLDEDRRRQARAEEWNQKEAAYHVLLRAVEKATGGQSPISAHTLFYHVRPLIQRYTSRILKSDYFEQTLLPAYQRQHGLLRLPDGRAPIYYEPRGVLIEPHSAREIPLGTREVSEYRFPAWLYDKILFVEKTGLWPALKDARLAERYDMAIVAGEGYATEACRVLFQKADRERDFQLFVLHDADPYGYNIARTLREETERMPGYRVKAHDIGLRLQDALDLRFEPEQFTRRQDIPQGLVLSELETEYFVGTQKTHGRNPSWVARRVELNAFENTGLIAYVERQLEAAGVRGKLIPPGKIAAEHFEEKLREELRDRISERILEEANIDQLVEDAVANLESEVREATENLEAHIREKQASDKTLSWRDISEGKAAELADLDE